MRNLKLFLTLLMLICIGVTQMWATDPVSTLTFTAQAGGKGTADDGVKWTVTSDGTESTCDPTKGIHFGTSSAQVTYIQLATSEISGTITKVVVNASTASGVTASASVTVGGSAFGGDAKSLSTSATNYTFEGSASGEIIVRVAKPSKAAKAIYVKSVAVTYTSGGGGDDPDPVLESITIGGDLSNKSYEEGQSLDFSGLTATGNYDDESTEDLTDDVEWSFSPALAVGTSSYTVTATLDEISGNKEITGVTVTAHVVTQGEYTINLTNTLFGTAVNTNITSAINASQNDISLVVNGTGSTKPRTDATYIRFYGSSSLRLSVPEGYNITKIVISENQSDYSAPSVSVGEFNTSTKTWTGKSNEVLWSFSAKSFIGQIKVTYEAITPEVTVDPTSLSFDAKQNIAVDGKTFTLTGANLSSGLTLAASTGFSVSPTEITAADAMAQGGVEVTVTPATPTETTTPVEGTVTISGGGLASNVVVNLSMAVTPTYLVALAVNDGDMGSATLNGGTASIYVTEDDEIALVATPAEHHEFVNWTVSNENIILNNANAASTTAMAGAAGTITANFQAQACTGLAAPVLDEVTTTYQSATIAWETVANADGYVLNIKKHEGNVPVVADEVIAAPAVSFEKTGLAANTQYDYTVMAVGDGTSFCDESNPLLEGNFTTNDYPSVAVTYSENNNSVSGGSKKIMTPFALPDEVTNEISGKTFVGWTTKSDFEDGDESDEETYFAKGANFTIQSNAAVTLYAVYATAAGGAGSTWVINKDNFSTVSTGSGYAPYNGDHTEDGITYNTNQVMLQSQKVQFQKNNGVMYNKTAFDADIVSIAIDGIDANITVYEGAEEISTGGTSITLADGVYPFSSGKRYFRIEMGNATGAATSITVNLAGATSYSDYVISGSAALPVLAAPTGLTAGTYYEAQTITLAATNDAAIYYSLDGNDPTVDAQHLYSEPFTLSERDVVTVKAIAVKSGYENSEVAEAEYNINLPYDFADFVALTPKVNGKEYAIRGIISQKDAQLYSGKLPYYISANGQTEGQIKCHNGLKLDKAEFTSVDDVNLGDNVTVVGTWSGQYNNIDGGNWMLEYTAREHASYAIEGALTASSFDNGDAFDDAILANLTVKETFTNGYYENVAGVTFNAGEKTAWADGDTKLTVKAVLNEAVIATKDFDVVVTSAQLASIALKADDENYQTKVVYYIGESFVAPTIVATLDDASSYEAEATLVSGFDNENAENVGVQEVTVSYTRGAVTETTSYSITMKAIFNTLATAYGVPEAKHVIENVYASTSQSTDSMFVSGIVVNNPNSDGTYYISDDGTSTNQLQVYKGKYFANSGSAQNNVKQGDEVILRGLIQVYSNAAELKYATVMSQLREPEFAIADIVAADEFEAEYSEDMTVVPTVNSGDAEFMLTSGNTDVVTIVNGKLHAVAEGDAEITAHRNATANENALNYKEATITFNVHVIAERDRYTVSFDADGGTGTDPVIANQLPGAPVELPENPYSKENSAFAGWVVNDGAVEITEGHFTMPEGNVTIKATWNVVATCAISFKVNGTEVATANAPQTAEFSLADVSHPTVPGFTWVGWSETEYAEEVENAPTTISSYTPAAQENTKTLYGIYSRLDNSSASYGKYVKATVVAEGDYLIVCEDQNKVFDGSLSTLDASGNTKAATIVDDVLTLENADNYVFVIAAKQGGYSIKSASNMYIGTTSNANSLATSATDTYTNTISISGGNVDIECSSARLRYNKTSGQERFRYFKSSSYSAQEAIQLYKKNLGTTYYTSSPVEKVTITFNANGGEGGCQKAIINKGAQLTICDEVPVKSHSDFAGWKNGDDEYVAGQAYTFDADITLTAQWEDAATYDVTYNVNGSSDAAPTQEAQYAGDQFEVGAAVTKEGFTFQGWKYGSKLYKAGASFTMPAEAVTFVAQWRKASVPVDKMSMVTSASALSNGMQIALGCSYVKDEQSYFAMAGDIASGKSFLSSETAENITLSDGVATYTDAVVVMTLEQVENGWKITKDGTNYLYAASNADMSWKPQADATVWTISFAGNNAIIASGDNKIQYNKQSPRFKTYTSQTDIQLFGKAVVVTEDASISDLGYTEGEAIVASGANVTLTIDEPTTVPSITAQNGATVVIDEPTTTESVVVEDGSKIVANAETTAPTVYFSTTMGSTQVPGTASELGSVTNITLATGGEIIYDLTLGTSMAGIQADPNQWHAFTLPFAVDAINGIYDAETGAKLQNEVNYAIMDYHGDIRANGDYGWKKYRGILQPGVFYLMTVDGNTKTFRFKASKVGAMTQTTSMGYKAYNGSGDPSKDFGWNGIGNPSWVSGTVTVNVQVLDPYSYTYQPLTINTNITVSTPFFYNAGGDGSTGSVVMQAAGSGDNYAPARTPANEIKNVAVSFGNEVFRDKIYISASEDALNEYEQDKDLVRMIMSNTPKVAQIFGNAYGMKLSMVNAPMVNDQATYGLTLYAPQAGEYTISAPAMDNADLYLTLNGAIIWNLSMGEYTSDFAKGNNEGYGLLLVKKAPQVTTGVENAEANETGVQKVIINEHVYILRAEQMYDVTGKAVR